MPSFRASGSCFLVETIPDLFYAGIDRDLPIALAHRTNGGYAAISHRELRAQVERLALALEGRLERGDRLAILSENRPE